MSRPAIVCSLPETEAEAVQTALVEAGFEVLTPADPAALETLMGGRRDVGAALLDADMDPARALAMAAALNADGRSVPTLVLAGPEALDRLLEAPRGALGDAEFFSRPYTLDALRWRVEAMLIRSHTFDDGSGPILEASQLPAGGLVQRSTIVAVFNPKGGVGKTTLATNLAMALQMRRGQQVLLVDADTTSGHIATSLGLEHVPSVADAWAEDDALPQGLAGVASAHSSGLRVAVLVGNPLQFDRIDPTRLAEHLTGSRLGFDILIIDLHPDYGPLNRVVFERADRILVPVTPDVPALRAALHFFEIAGDLGIRDRLAMVVNRANSGVSVADMERTTGMRTFGTIRSGGLRFVRAANEGLTVVEKYPRDKVTDDFMALADRLLGREPHPAPAANRSLFGFLGRQRDVSARA